MEKGREPGALRLDITFLFVHGGRAPGRAIRRAGPHADESGMVGRTTSRDARSSAIFLSQVSRTRMPLPGIVVVALLVAGAIVLRVV